MTVRLLIDGYNLLYATGAVAQNRGPGGLTRARDRLLKQLGTWLSDSERRHTQIVFDARRAPGRGESEQAVHGITVTFSIGFEEADDLLEQLIRQHPQPRSLVVISSDQRVQRCARARKAQTFTCDQWLMQFADGPPPQRSVNSASDASQPSRDKVTDKPSVGKPSVGKPSVGKPSVEKPSIDQRGAQLSADEVARWLDEFGLS